VEIVPISTPRKRALASAGAVIIRAIRETQAISLAATSADNQKSEIYRPRAINAFGRFV
jgi:hypothetical protein